MLAPSIVDQNRLQSGNLLNEVQKRKALEFFAKNPRAVLYAGEDELPYPVARSKEGKIFVLYATAKQLHYTPAETSKIAFQNDTETTIKPLGGGANAIVVAAQSLEDDSWYAAKFQTTTREEEAIRQEITREQRVLRAMNLAKGSATIEQVNTVLDPHSVTTMTIMELAPGKKLESLIEEDKSKSTDQKITLEQKLNLAIKITRKTDELTKKGLVQCDFNPKNIMCQIISPIEEETSLIDFGEVYELNAGGEFVSQNKIPETPGFGAPEISQGGYFAKKGSYSENTMAFSLGKTLGALFGEGGQTPTITEKAMHEVVRKLSHVDPNQRMSAELAFEEFNIIKDYHALLKKLGSLENHKDIPSLLQHMRKTQEGKGSEVQAALQTLERRLIACQHKQAVYQYQKLGINLSRYIQDCKARDPKPKSHIKDMEKVLKKIQKLDPSQADFASKLENLRGQAYNKQTQFEAKMRGKQSKEPVKLVDSVVKWVRSLSLPSLSRSPSFSRDSEKLSKSVSTLSAPPSDLSRDASSSSISSSSQPLLSASSSVSVNDNPLYSLDSPLPPPIVLRRNNGGKPLPPIPSRSPTRSPREGISASSSSSTESVTSSADFSPAFKMELEKKLAASNPQSVSEEVNPNTSSKVRSKRGMGA